MSRTIGGRYQLLRVIGAGSVGTVWEAEHLVTRRRIALKLINPEAAAGTTVASRFIREAKASAAIGHDAVIDVLDAGQDSDGSLYLVLELLRGRSLQEALPSRTPTEVAQIMIEVLDGLAAAHASGFVHRDVKPANIFLAETPTGEQKVKLLDFGIAKELGPYVDRITATGAIVGTVDYMSPEQALSEEVDARSDIWAAGAILFRAFTGRPPFVRDKLINALDARTREPSPRVADLADTINPHAAAVVDRALARLPKDRFQTADEMRDALQDALGVAPTVFVPERSRTTDVVERPSSAAETDPGTEDTYVPSDGLSPVLDGAPTLTVEPRRRFWPLALAGVIVGGLLVALLREDAPSPEQPGGEAVMAAPPVLSSPPPPTPAVQPVPVPPPPRRVVKTPALPKKVIRRRSPPRPDAPLREYE